jgi:predicted small secreted protein
MPKLAKSLAVLLVVAVAGMALQGCNTFRGAGKDIQRGGEAIENSSNETQPQFDSTIYTTESPKIVGPASVAHITLAAASRSEVGR